MTDCLDRIEDKLIREVTIIDIHLDMMIDQLITPSAATDVARSVSDFFYRQKKNSTTLAFCELIASLTSESNESLESEYCNAPQQNLRLFKLIATQIHSMSSSVMIFLLYSTFPLFFFTRKKIKNNWVAIDQNH